MPRLSPPIKVGDRFGFWEVLELVNSSEAKAICHGCKNKTIKKVQRSGLKRGKTTSCGCQRNVKVIGHAKKSRIEKHKKLIEENQGMFGFWQVLDFENAPVGKWFVKCTGCGRESLKNSYDIMTGSSKSCGCKQGENLFKTMRESLEESWEEKLTKIKAKKQKTCLARYNTLYSSQAKEVKDKIKQTFQEKYGTHPLAHPEIRERIKKTNLKIFGCENPGSNSEIKQKVAATNIERFGIDRPSKLKHFQDKAKETTLKNHGVESWVHLPENRNKLKQWCEENPDKLFVSKPEQEILDWVREFYPEARKYKQDGHEIDIFIPELNIGIEHNGLYWHSEQRKPRNYHLEKTLYYQSRGIRIIHIWEHLWRDRKDQVKSFLRSALKLNQNKIAARKCEVIFTNDKEEIKKSHDLLEKTHIQGKPHATRFVANVYYKEDLLATASFALHHRTSKDWVLTRFTTKDSFTIQGILSKISNLASRNLNSKIISWADFSLSDGNGYAKAGWKLEKQLSIDYFYYDIAKDKVISKQSRQKRSVGTPEAMTELEHALLDGLIRIWDCGKIRFSFLKENG